MASTNQILLAMTAMASLGVAVFFLRFWRRTRDRLFAWFALAFTLFAANWTVLASLSPSQEARHLVYLIRLAGFALIIQGVVEKNRGTGPRGPAAGGKD
jgi:hypothetical protein